MITRRKLWGIAAGAAGTIGLGMPTPSRLEAAVDAEMTKMIAEFPSTLLARHGSVEFAQMKKWFRDHPQFLWARAG